MKEPREPVDWLAWADRLLQAIDKVTALLKAAGELAGKLAPWATVFVGLLLMARQSAPPALLFA